jgi:hypothetical protein
MPATFSGGCACGAIRVHGSMRSQIKYIATYQVAPISAITHIAPVKSIEPWKDSGKFVVNFAEPARAIDPIPPCERRAPKSAAESPLYVTEAAGCSANA